MRNDILNPISADEEEMANSVGKTQHDRLTADITMDEVMGTFRNNKSQGSDGCPAE